MARFQLVLLKLLLLYVEQNLEFFKTIWKKDSAGNKRTYGGTGWTAVTYETEERNENEKKRQIKIIRPERIKRVLREFERIMSDE